MGKPIDSRALAILKKLNLDQKDDQGQYKALWDCRGTWVMYHRFIEQAGAENGIVYSYDEIETNSADGIVVVMVSLHLRILKSLIHMLWQRNVLMTDVFLSY